MQDNPTNHNEKKSNHDDISRAVSNSLSGISRANKPGGSSGQAPSGGSGGKTKRPGNRPPAGGNRRKQGGQPSDKRGKPPQNGRGARGPADRNRSRSGGKRPTMAGLIDTVNKTSDKSPEALQSLDSQQSGMLYPASQFQEAPKQVRDKEGKLRVIPLAGLEEIGRNCMAIEYGDDIIIVDIGFMFPDETMPGIDYVLPDVTYLEKKQRNIKGIFITHGHLDHIGGAPWILPKLGFPKVYASRLCRAIMESNLEEHGLTKRVPWQTVQYDDVYHVGVFTVRFFHVNHNIPEGMGVAIDTPVGTIVHTGDFKFDETPVADQPAEFEKIRKIGERGVLLAMSDSTNTEIPGHTPSEKEIGQNMHEQISGAKGRVIMATFSTLIARLQQALDAAALTNRKVSVTGRSMLRNVEICQRLGYLDIPKGILVDPRHLNKYRDSEILVLCTGSQGDEMSALNRMANGEHRQVQIKQGDTVILSSSPIPGNERSIEGMMDNLFRLGADVIYSKLYDIHSSGHAFQDEQRQMIELLKPKHFMPVHGEYRKRVLHGRIAMSLGIPPTNVHLADNGQVLEANHRGTVSLTKEKVPANLVFVDGLGVGDVGQVVLRDRKHMSEGGMFVIIVMVDRKTGRLIGSPDIISRGFTYLREAGDLLKELRVEVRKQFQTQDKQHQPGHAKQADYSYIKNKLREVVEDFLYKKTERQPMVLPVVLEV